MRNYRPKARFLFQLRRTAKGYNGKGTFAFALAGRGLTLKRSTNGTVYKLCDLDHVMQGAEIDCDGIIRPAKVVLKIYTRIPQKQLEAHKAKVRYERLLRGKPELTK